MGSWRIFPTYVLDLELGRTHSGGDANPMNWEPEIQHRLLPRQRRGWRPRQVKPSNPSWSRRGQDSRFWRLAQARSALYPSGTE